jgi:PhnB protein
LARLNAYLHFNGNCREAMEFYKECLGGELKIQTMGDSPMGSNATDESKNLVMHSVLSRDRMVLMASDMMSSDPTTGNQISLCLLGENFEELRTLFDKLAEGGKVHQDLKEEFFGTYGDLTDRFGLDWMFQADKE